MKPITLKDLPNQITAELKPLRRYSVVLFAVFVVALCSYLVVQINQAANIEPSSDQSAVAAKATPQIDPSVVKKLQDLQDNSVSVKSLFNSARSDPFQ